MSLWTGEFGDQYTQRCAIPQSVDARLIILRKLLDCDVESVLEVGANIGLNLQAISKFSDCELYATEPNETARNELYCSGLVSEENIRPDFADHMTWPDGIAEAVLTCGVLIHIKPEKLLASMKEIHRCARRWIICGEYFAPQEEMIPYRGHKDALWRRDYGSLWMDNFPDLQCHCCVFTWKRMTGLDNLTFWLFEKGERPH